MIGAIIGIASTVATTAMSFAQANKQKQLQKQAEQEADKAMFAARKRLEVNYMDALSVQKEPYELARQAMLAQGTQATQAGQESERGAAATAGRVQMGQNEAQGDIRTAMGKELTEIERLKVAEDARLRDLNTQLDLGEVEGAQMAAANAQEMSANAMEQGFAGVTSAATQAANLVPLYGKTKQQTAVPGTNANTVGVLAGDIQGQTQKSQLPSFLDFNNLIRPKNSPLDYTRPPVQGTYNNTLGVLAPPARGAYNNTLGVMSPNIQSGFMAQPNYTYNWMLGQ
jgi:hypothetical protein